MNYWTFGDEIMLEIKDEFKSQIKELDEMLYYDPEELKRIGEQQIREAAIEDERKKIVKNMINKNYSKSEIKDLLNITDDKINEILRELDK